MSENNPEMSNERESYLELIRTFGVENEEELTKKSLSDLQLFIQNNIKHILMSENNISASQIRALIASGNIDFLIENIDFLIENIDKCVVVGNEFANLLYSKKKYSLLVKTLKKFDKVDGKIGVKLFEENYLNPFDLTDNIGNFSEDTHSLIALALLNNSYGSILIESVENFKKLNKEVALKLIQGGNTDVIIENLNKYSGLDKEIALKLFIQRGPPLTPKNVALFCDDNFEEFILELIEQEDFNKFDNLVVDVLSEEFKSILCNKLVNLQNIQCILRNPDLLRVCTEEHQKTIIEFAIGKENIIPIVFAEDGLSKTAIELYGDQIEEILKSNFCFDLTIEKVLHLKNIWGKNTADNFCSLVSSIHQSIENISFLDHLKPIIHSQGIGSAEFLRIISIKVKNLDLQIFKGAVAIAKRKGVVANNFLESIYIPLINSKDFDFENEYSEIFLPYIQKLSIANKDIYEEYRKIYMDFTGNERDKKCEEFIRDIYVYKVSIYSGECSEEMFKNSKYSSIQLSVFPPAKGVSNRDLHEIGVCREDRQGDVIAKFEGEENLNDFENVCGNFSLSIGTYSLKGGERLELKKWEELSDVIKEVHKEEKIKNERSEDFIEDIKENGKKILGWYKEKNSNNFRKQLWSMMYKHEVILGRRLPENFSMTIDGLMEYKEFIGDRVKSDYVREMLEQVKETNEYKTVEKEISQKMKIRKPKQAAGKILQMIDIYESNIKSHENIEWALWNTYSITPVEVQTLIEEKDSIEDKKTAIINYIENRVNRLETNIESAVIEIIGRKLVYEDNKQMRKELDKFQFQDTNEIEVNNVDLEFKISKKKSHNIAGFNMGVCVALDESLWNDPDFANVICFSKTDKTAMGGMHFHWKEYEGKKYLMLPGINPSLELLGKVNAHQLYKKNIDFAKEVARKTNCQSVWIPIEPGIHSNRDIIQNEIVNANYSKIERLKEEIPFSEEPKYTVQEVYVIDL